MKKWFVISLPLVAGLLSSGPLMAQSDDFGIWGEVNVEKKLSQRWDASLGAEFRSRDNVKTADRWSIEAGVGYKFTDWLKASLGYSFLYDHNHKVNSSGKKYSDYWGPRHRLNLSLTASQQFGLLNISLRERWQYTYRPEQTVDRYWNYDDEDDDIVYGEKVVKGGETQTHTYRGKGKSVWRNRLQLKYRLSKMWRPYLSAESSVASGLEKIRYAAGTEIRLNKNNSFDLKYMYQHSYGDDEDGEGNRHIIGIGYTYKF